jgi:hypothetical protein
MQGTMHKNRAGLFVPGARERPRILWTPTGLKMPPIRGGAAKTYVAYSGAMPTTAAIAKVTTGTTLKVMQQLATASTKGIRVIEWGISFDAVAAAPVECELIQVNVACTTGTAYVANDLQRMNGPNDEVSTLQLGTALSCYTPTTQGAITTTRVGDYQLVAQQYVKQFPLGREFEIAVSSFCLVRVTAAVSAGAVSYIVWEE